MLTLARSIRHSRLGKKLFPDLREKLAATYLSGDGIEIGGLHNPLKLPARCTVKYVDRASKEELIRLFPEIDAKKIVAPDIVDDGFVLGSVAADSQNFLIANHVLEHASNPLGTLHNWARVIKPGGLLFISLPRVDRCFDRGRMITTVEHLIEDERLCQAGDTELFRKRNREHYVEWETISLPVIHSARPPGLREDHGVLEQDVERRLDALEDIHFHTFSYDSVERLVAYLSAIFTPGFERLSCVQGRSEIIAVLKKSSSTAA